MFRKPRSKRTNQKDGFSAEASADDPGTSALVRSIAKTWMNAAQSRPMDIVEENDEATEGGHGTAEMEDETVAGKGRGGQKSTKVISFDEDDTRLSVGTTGGHHVDNNIVIETADYSPFSSL